MNKAHRRTLPLIAISVILTGCAEVSFKRGRSAADFDADKSACQREVDGSGASLAECLEQRGWFLHQFADEQSEDATDSAAAGNDAEAGVETAGTEKPAGTASEAKPRVARKKQPAPAGPAVIGTWFKLGAGPGALDADQAACVAELGEEHAIRSASQPVSPAMRACLKQRGWFGLESSQTR